MNLTEFKKLNKKYSKLPLPKAIWDTPEYNAYINAFHNNKECTEWELKRRIKEAGINYKKYCCINMAYRLIEEKKSKGKAKIDFDSIMTHYKKGNVFGIPIHDGGSSFIKIDYCPWCGKLL
jgi:hypothetical protein